MTEYAHCLFTDDYTHGTSRGLLEDDKPNWMKGKAALTSHSVAALGMKSAGNISFDMSTTTFEGSLKSDGDTAFLNSAHASVVLGAPAETQEMMSDDAEESFGRRRLLQEEDGSIKNYSAHLVGGFGFLSKGNISMTPGSDTNFQGSLHHSGLGLVSMKAEGRALFTGKHSEEEASTGRKTLAVDWKQSDGLRKHKIAGLGTDSAGIISVELAVTTFEGPFKSDGKGAFMQGLNATVEFTSSQADRCLGKMEEAAADEGEASMSHRRLLQLDEECVHGGALTKHLVGCYMEPGVVQAWGLVVSHNAQVAGDAGAGGVAAWPSQGMPAADAIHVPRVSLEQGLEENQKAQGIMDGYAQPGHSAPTCQSQKRPIGRGTWLLMRALRIFNLLFVTVTPGGFVSWLLFLWYLRCCGATPRSEPTVGMQSSSPVCTAALLLPALLLSPSFFCLWALPFINALARMARRCLMILRNPVHSSPPHEGLWHPFHPLHSSPQQSGRPGAYSHHRFRTKYDDCQALLPQALTMHIIMKR